MIGFLIGIVGIFVLLGIEYLSMRLEQEPPEDWTSWEDWDWPNDFRDWDDDWGWSR